MLTTSPIREMMTPKTVHARASSAERFHVICPETNIYQRFCYQKSCHCTGSVKQSDPKNWIFWSEPETCPVNHETKDYDDGKGYRP